MEISTYTTEDLTLLSDCRICPRECGADRVNGQKSICGIGLNPIIASSNLHFGEEPPISGNNGSGTIFFSGCNMKCIYCQNYPISQQYTGKEVTLTQLAEKMLSLQKRGAHNINFVTPSHMTIPIIRAVEYARKNGLNIPIVYNSSGYDSPLQLEMLKNIVDIFLVDMRYSSNEYALKYSGVGNYVEINRNAVKAMHNLVGDLQMDNRGIARKGLIIRHLVLPQNISGTEDTFRFIAQNISKTTYISLMSQYFPAYNAIDDQLLSRKIKPSEYHNACRLLEKYGLQNGWIQSIN